MAGGVPYQDFLWIDFWCYLLMIFLNAGVVTLCRVLIDARKAAVDFDDYVVVNVGSFWLSHHILLRIEVRRRSGLTEVSEK